jgi:hypothetical protein
MRFPLLRRRIEVLHLRNGDTLVYYADLSNITSDTADQIQQKLKRIVPSGVNTALIDTSRNGRLGIVRSETT